MYSKTPEIKKLENTHISKEQETETINFATYIFNNVNVGLQIEQVEQMEM